MKTTRINFTTMKTILLAVLTILFMTAAARAATYTVNSTADNEANGCAVGVCTLREAITAANASADNDTINFAALTGQTITLAGSELTIGNNGTLTINGPATGSGITVSGGNGATNNNRVFFINSGATAEIKNLLIRNGRITDNYGAGIYNLGILTLTNSTVSYNSARNGGGGIENAGGGYITLTNSTVSNNSVFGLGVATGGGIENAGGSALTLINSTVSNNFGGTGGGIFNGDSTLTLDKSTVNNNSARSSGGGIYNDSSFTRGGTLTLSSSTVSNNSAPNDGGGGIYNNGGSTTNIDNTIIANSTGGDCFRSFGTINASYSLIEDGTGCVSGTNSNNLTGDPKLGPLANNGGATQTHALQSDSIAIDKGNSTLSTDQRGSVRPVDQNDGYYPNAPGGNGSDIGSFEVQPLLTVDTTADDASLSACTDAVLNDCSLRGAISKANATATGETINFAASLAGQTITLTTGTQLTIANNGALTINGGSGITVSGGNGTTNTNRVFLVNSGAAAAINNLTIRNGRTGNPGGGIYNGGILTLTNSTVSFNSAGSDGGGIENGSGTLTLINSTVSNNSTRNGGGIDNFGSTLTLINSTVSNNSATNSGGGIYNSNGGSVTLSSSTVSNNSATGGGGIFNTANSATNLDNTIIANSNGGDCFRDSGTINASYSLIEDGSCGVVNGVNNNLTGDPNLGPLQNNDGPTQTHALLSGSIAIDKGNSALPTDQRGAVRPADDPAIPNAPGGNGSDIGSFEVPPATHFSVSAPANAIAGQQFTFTVTALDANNNTVTAYSGTVRFTSTDPNAVLPANANLNNGTGTFSATLNSYGSQTITATDTANAAVMGTSNQIQVQLANTTTGIVITRADDRNAACTANDCSLREAIAAANSLPSNDTIAFDIPNCANNTCTITLSGGELRINATSTAGKLTITNTGSTTKIVVSGNNTSRVFFVREQANLTLDRLTVTGGNGAGIGSGGGGIYNNQGGTLTLTNSTVAGNSASGVGGGILNFGTATLTNSTVAGNTANGDGGGIFNNSGGTLTITNSTFSGNAVTSGGGGGIYNLRGTTTITNSTVAGNSGAKGGGISKINDTVNLSNSIVAANTATASAPDISGTVTSQGYNLIGNNSGATVTAQTGDQIGTSANPIDPKLASLADNLGPTPTRALLSGSPAIDQGNSMSPTDQRGFARRVDDANSTNGAGNLADIGASEVQAPTAASVSVSGRVTVGNGRGLTNAVVTLTAANGETRTTRTSSFGYYRFEAVEVGQTLIFTVSSKRYQFSPQVVSVTEQTSELNFTAHESFPPEVQ